MDRLFPAGCFDHFETFSTRSFFIGPSSIVVSPMRFCFFFWAKQNMRFFISTYMYIHCFIYIYTIIFIFSMKKKGVQRNPTIPTPSAPCKDGDTKLRSSRWQRPRPRPWRPDLRVYCLGFFAGFRGVPNNRLKPQLRPPEKSRLEDNFPFEMGPF